MENKKLTAVEWLIEQIDNKDMGEIPIWIYDFCYDALEMEKEQIIESYDAGLYDTTFCEKVHAEQYYNETYKS